MSININKYIDLLKRCAIYGENGDYIDSSIIHRMIVEELKLPMSFYDIEAFINTCEISITEDEIKEFLDKKFEEENPQIKINLELYKLERDEEIKRRKYEEQVFGYYIDTKVDSYKSAREFGDNLVASRYYFEPYSLQYFKTYTSILKEKCQTLLSVLNDISRCKSEKLSEDAEQRLLDLDFHVNSEGNIHYKDAERLADAIIYNIKDLYEKIQIGNNPETYLTFKESEHQLMRDDVWESEIYPNSKIQIKDRYYAQMPQFISLSEAQQTQVQKENSESHSRWLERISKSNVGIIEKGAILCLESNKSEQKRV